jgi:hypothetical protein
MTITSPATTADLKLTLLREEIRPRFQTAVRSIIGLASHIYDVDGNIRLREKAGAVALIDSCFGEELATIKTYDDAYKILSIIEDWKFATRSEGFRQGLQLAYSYVEGFLR